MIVWALWESNGFEGHTRILHLRSGRDAREVLRCQGVRRVERGSRGVRRFFLEGGGMLAAVAQRRAA